MATVIILEGGDGAGKTTLANALVQSSAWPAEAAIVKSPGMNLGWENTWDRWAWYFMGGSDKVWILDRIPVWSEMVYGSLRGEMRTNDLWVKFLKEIGSPHVTTVLCTGTPDSTVAHKDATDKPVDVFDARAMYKITADLAKNTRPDIDIFEWNWREYSGVTDHFVGLLVEIEREKRNLL